MSGDFAGRLSRLMSAKHGAQKIGEIVRALKECGQSEPASDGREHGEYDERPKHAPRRFMNVYLVLVKARLATEGQKNEPEHVERRKQRRQQTERVKNGFTGWALK